MIIPRIGQTTSTQTATGGIPRISTGTALPTQVTQQVSQPIQITPTQKRVDLVNKTSTGIISGVKKLRENVVANLKFAVKEGIKPPPEKIIKGLKFIFKPVTQQTQEAIQNVKQVAPKVVQETKKQVPKLLSTFLNDLPPVMIAKIITKAKTPEGRQELTDKATKMWKFISPEPIIGLESGTLSPKDITNPEGRKEIATAISNFFGGLTSATLPSAGTISQLQSTPALATKNIVAGSSIGLGLNVGTTALAGEKQNWWDNAVATLIGGYFGAMIPEKQITMKQAVISDARSTLEKYGITNKKDYRAWALKNHPDVFPEASRPQQKLIMDEVSSAIRELANNSTGLEGKVPKAPSTLPSILKWTDDLWKKITNPPSKTGRAIVPYIEQTIPQGEYTSSQLLGKVINSPIEKTAEGREVIKTALEAQKTNQNIVVSSAMEATKVPITTKAVGIEKVETPKPEVGKNVNVTPQTNKLAVNTSEGRIQTDLTKEELEFFSDEVKNLIQTEGKEVLHVDSGEKLLSTNKTVSREEFIRLYPEAQKSFDKFNKVKPTQPKGVGGEPIKTKPEVLKEVLYDSKQLEKRILNPSTVGNPLNSYEVQIRYKGFIADKAKFDTKKEAQKFVDNYEFKGMTTNVAEDYMKSKLFKEQYMAGLKPQPKGGVPEGGVKEITELELKPTTSKTPEKIIKEKEELNSTNYNFVDKYERPGIGKMELQTMLKSSNEFSRNPVLTVVKGRAEEGAIIMLEFKGDKLKFRLNPDALNLKSENLKIGQKIKVNEQSLKEAPGVHQMRVYKNGKVYASVGKFAELDNVTQKAIKDIKTVEFPELVNIVKELIGKVPSVEKIRDKMGGATTGFFTPDGEGNITLNIEAFKDENQIVKALAHELGHLTDYLPTKTMARGNLLGRIGSLNRYMKSFLPEKPGSKGIITKKDKYRLKKEAKEIANKPITVEEEVIVGEMKATPKEILSIWQDSASGIKNPDLLRYIQHLSDREKVEIAKEAMRGNIPEWVSYRNEVKKTITKEVIQNAPEDIKRIYRELLEKEIEKRRLLYVETVRDELRRLSQLWKPFNEAKDLAYTAYRFSSEELYADAISVLFNDPVLLQQKAPMFYRGFFNYLENKPDVKETFNATWDLLSEGEEAVFKKRDEDLSRSFGSGEEGFTAKILEQQKRRTSLMYQMKLLFDDKNTPILYKMNKARKAGIEIPPELNPDYALKGLLYSDGELKNYINKNFQPAFMKAQEVPDGWVKTGKVLFYDRVIMKEESLLIH